MTDSKTPTLLGKIYYPPKPEVLDRYAQALTEALEAKDGKRSVTTEVLHGLTEFLKVTTTIYANHLNRHSLEKNL